VPARSAFDIPWQNSLTTTTLMTPIPVANRAAFWRISSP
jgi:hypothetical protein